MMEDFKWYIIVASIFLVAAMAVTAIADWRSMDCRLSLGQAGRPVAEIKEICK